MGNAATRREAARARNELIRAKAAVCAGPAAGAPRFVADVMLGRLAKWLRIAGFDVLYSNRFSDDELVRISRLQDRVLLSRDTRLLVRREVKNFIFLESQDPLTQFRHVIESTGLSALPALLTRCLSCNRILVPTEREKVRDAIPPFVYSTHARYKSCPGCGKIFWAGTHRDAAVRTLRDLLGGIADIRA
ncbi:MAG: Mut7-C RNAse domain-containing protein [Acidobacteria bacterium]|nr:Mut7-C RNAse domain-containing protein [Acidobacteriota bacterium]